MTFQVSGFIKRSTSREAKGFRQLVAPKAYDHVFQELGLFVAHQSFSRPIDPQQCPYSARELREWDTGER